MSIERKVKAAVEALGYGARVFITGTYIDVYKCVYLCSAECGGIGCRVDATVRIYKTNGEVKAFVNGYSSEDLEAEAEKAEDEQETACLLCQKDYAEWLEAYVSEHD